MKRPRCQSSAVVKNGTMYNGKPKWKCKDCSRQFVAEPRIKRIGEETRALIDKLLLERLPLAGIVRASSVSAR